MNAVTFLNFWQAFFKERSGIDNKKISQWVCLVVGHFLVRKEIKKVFKTASSFAPLSMNVMSFGELLTLKYSLRNS